MDEADTLPLEAAGCPVDTSKAGSIPSLEAPSEDMMNEAFRMLWSEPAKPFDTQLQYKKIRALVHARQAGEQTCFLSRCMQSGEAAAASTVHA